MLAVESRCTDIDSFSSNGGLSRTSPPPRIGRIRKRVLDASNLDGHRKRSHRGIRWHIENPSLSTEDSQRCEQSHDNFLCPAAPRLSPQPSSRENPSLGTCTVGFTSFPGSQQWSHSTFLHHMFPTLCLSLYNTFNVLTNQLLIDHHRHFHKWAV